MRYLSLDIGLRHTGCALGDSEVGIALALETIHHKNFDELISELQKIIAERKVHKLIVGLPLLPSGEKGEQAKLIEELAEAKLKALLPLEFIDERHTTSKSSDFDGDAAAACAILGIALEKDTRKGFDK